MTAPSRLTRRCGGTLVATAISFFTAAGSNGAVVSVSTRDASARPDAALTLSVCLQPVGRVLVEARSVPLDCLLDLILQARPRLGRYNGRGAGAVSALGRPS